MRRARQLLALLLVVTLLAGILPGGVLAAEDKMVIRADSITALIGAEVTATISVESNPGLSGLQVQLEYDSSILTLTAVDYTASSTTGLTAQPSQKLDSPVKLTWYNGTADSTYNGVLATLHFTVREDAAAGTDTPLHLIVDENNVSNIHEQNVPFQAVDGEVLVVNYTPGDINNDQQVNIKDLIRLAQYLADWEVEVVEACMDTNGDGSVNIKDLIRLAQYLADWEVELYPKPAAATCTHTLTAVEAKAATCVAEGNTAYWVCSKCGKLFADSEGQVKTDAESVKTAKNPENHANIVVDPAVPATSTSTGLTEGSHCAVDGGKGCGKVITAQTIVEIPVKSHTITYNLVSGQTYLAEKKEILEQRNADNPTSYNEGDEFLIEDLNALDLGFQFDGWYTASGTRVDQITAEDTKNYVLYARWTENEYKIQYNVNASGGGKVGEITDETKLSYTVSMGLYSLPTPEIYNYLFLGWYDHTTGERVTEIPVGSTGHRVLDAYVATKRNLAKAVSSLGKPIVLEDTDNGVIYFTYEIGTIYNVPVSDPIWRVNAVSGLAQQKSVTVTKTVGKDVSKTMAETVSSAAQDSDTWALSSGWDEVITANKEWAESKRLTQEEAKSLARTSTGSYSTTDYLGCTETMTTADETKTITYDSKTETENDKTQWDINGKLSGGYEHETDTGAKLTVPVKIGTLDLSGSVKSKFNIGLEIEGGYQHIDEDTTETHSGTDTTTLDTTTKSRTDTWNCSATSSLEESLSTSETVSTVLQRAISETSGYSTARGTESSEAQTHGRVTTDSKTGSTSDTVMYSEAESTTTTSTYSTDGKFEGSYRLVQATNLHVFAVVGYDIGSGAYFHYSYSIADGKTYEFLDYSPDGSFKDDQVTVLPFEIPTLAYDYTRYLTVETAGLEFDYDNQNHTATVVGYFGDSTQVVIPTYTVDDGGTAFKVTAVGERAFATEQGSKITDISFGDYVTSIGSEAFAGCTALNSMIISTKITDMGSNAFRDCPGVTITVNSAAMAEAAAVCGAMNISLDISALDSAEKVALEVPACDSFTLLGGAKTFTGLTLNSDAESTTIKSVYISGSTTPVKISSSTVTLYRTEIRDSSDLCMVLSAENATLNLSGTNVMTSARDNALLAKSVTVKYTNSGRLKLTGNLLYTGSITDESSRIAFVDRGEKKLISSSDFANYENGRITVTFEPNGGSVTPETMECYLGEKLGDLPTPTREHYSFAGWFTQAEGGDERTADSTATADLTLYAHWTLIEYMVNWNEATGVSIAVTRSESPNANATLGALTKGSRVYFGDVLQVTYTPAGGYEITSKGETTITVTGNIDSSQIYAAAKAKSIAYTVLYRSANGTDLGSDTVTHDFGSSYTISAPAKYGYVTPDAQTVAWDSTNAKTITFVYGVSSVAASQAAASGRWWTATGYNNSYINYSASVEVGARTATSVNLRVVWTQTISYAYFGYAQYFNATCNGVSTGDVTIATTSTWANNSGIDSRTVYSGWITVPVSATDTSVTMSTSWWTPGVNNGSGSWQASIAIPTY